MRRDIKQFFEERPDIKKLLTAPDGKIYSLADLPLQQVMTPLFIRQVWLDKLSLSAPGTLDEWVDVLIAFKEKDSNDNGKQDEIPLVLRPGQYTYFGSAFGMQSPVQQFWADESGKVEYQFLSQSFMELLALAVLDYLLQQDSMLVSAGVADANTVALKAPQSPSGSSGNYLMRSPLWNHYGITAKSKILKSPCSGSTTHGSVKKEICTKIMG